MQRMDKFLLLSQTAIKNSQQKEEIREPLTSYGYTTDVVREGLNLYEKVVQLSHKRLRCLGEQLGATEDFHRLRDKINFKYKQHVKLARIALRDRPDIAEAMLLKGERSKAFGQWMRQAEVFYHNSLNFFPPEYKRFGLTRKSLNETKKQLTEVSQLHYIQLQKMSAAQEATRERNEAYTKLNRWMGDFKAVARIALDHSPQLLESLGIVVKR